MKKNFKQKTLLSTISLAMAFTAFGSITNFGSATKTQEQSEPSRVYSTVKYEKRIGETTEANPTTQACP